jgi:predicted transcriptional regulator
LKYRSRTEIITAVLRSINNGATKTRIMYGAYISYAQIQEYIHFLAERGLIRLETGSGLYKLTEKGLNFLRNCEQINDVISLDNDVEGKMLTVEEEEAPSSRRTW